MKNNIFLNYNRLIEDIFPILKERAEAKSITTVMNLCKEELYISRTQFYKIVHGRASMKAYYELANKYGLNINNYCIKQPSMKLAPGLREKLALLDRSSHDNDRNADLTSEISIEKIDDLPGNEIPVIDETVDMITLPESIRDRLKVYENLPARTEKCFNMIRLKDLISSCTICRPVILTVSHLYNDLDIVTSTDELDEGKYLFCQDINGIILADYNKNQKTITEDDWSFLFPNQPYKWKKILELMLDFEVDEINSMIVPDEFVEYFIPEDDSVLLISCYDNNDLYRKIDELFKIQSNPKLSPYWNNYIEVENFQNNKD